MISTSKDLFNQALNAADHYRGDEAGYAHLGETLILLEAAMRTEYKIPKGRVPDALEQKFNQTHGGMKLTLNGLLTRADRAQMRFLQQWVDDDKAAAANALLADITSIKTNFAVLPPKKDAAPVLGDGTGELKAPEFRPRRAEVLHFLTNTEFAGQRVFMDQLLRYEGTLLPGQMRKASYDVIDIIPWGIQIAVCDQVGEAMFVMPKPASEFSIADWGRFDKDVLVEQHGGIQIKMNGLWREKLSEVIAAKLSGADFVLLSKFIIAATKKRAREGRIPFTDLMHEDYKFESYRTDLGSIKIRIGMGANWPKDLTENVLNKWPQKNPDGSWRAVTCVAQDYHSILEWMRTKPTVFRLEIDNRREKLIAEMERAGHKKKSIFNKMGDVKPDGLTEARLAGWTSKHLDGSYVISICEENHYNTVMNWLALQPDAFRLDVDGRRDKLITEMERTGFGSVNIYRAIGAGRPEELTLSMIRNLTHTMPDGSWLIQTCKKEYYDIIMKCLKSQPDALPGMSRLGRGRKKKLPVAPLASGAEPL